ncbi:MAG TPA: ABC transporter ATP-binding protein [Candidatus Limnocylindria bacterium]|nr:ABC transporter ATP-binding protein [Candidatus Limnocylindria bacterium]
MATHDDIALDEEFAQTKMRGSLLQRLFSYTRPYRGTFIWNLILTVLATASTLLGPKLIQYGIDEYLTPAFATYNRVSQSTSAEAGQSVSKPVSQWEDLASVAPSGSLADSPTRSFSPSQGILIVSALYLANLLVGWALSVIQVRAAITIGQGAMNDLRLAVFEHIQRLSLNYFDRTHQGRIIARADSDVDALDRVLTWGATQALSSLVTLVGVVALMLHYDWRLCLAVCSVLVPLALATKWFHVRGREAYRQLRGTMSRLTASMAENISGVRVVQAFGRETENLNRFRALHDDFTARWVASSRVFHTYMPAVGFLAGISTAVLLGYGGWRVQHGAITVGALAAFVLYLGMFFGPIQTMGDLYNAMLSAAASAERIFALLDTEPQVRDRAEARALPPIRGDVTFDQVSFRYDTTPAEQWVLRDISFTVRAGETVALVGHTGSGKTSVISLLARFYEPQSGRILLDAGSSRREEAPFSSQVSQSASEPENQRAGLSYVASSSDPLTHWPTGSLAVSAPDGFDISRHTLESLHRQLGIVTQENFLFTGTVMDNLRFGRPDATDAEVIAAATKLGTHDVIARLPEGYHTKVGERGGNFSAGERQLITITRAMVAEPRILIFDEATSAVDPQTERLIQHALEELFARRTSFVIAHRLSTVRHANLILVLDHGRIVERGTHDELLALGGTYAGLHAEFVRA